MIIMVSSSKLVSFCRLLYFFLKATFGIPASFTSGMQMSLRVCTLTWIFPAMAPLLCEQVGESVHVSSAPGEPKMVQQILL